MIALSANRLRLLTHGGDMFFVRWIGNIAQSYQRSFSILMVGQSIFFVGLALFYLSAEQQVIKPLLAEFLVLLSIIIVSIGVLVALVGYLALTYGRWYHFFRKTKKNTAFTKDEGLDPVEPHMATQAVEQTAIEKTETNTDTAHADASSVIVNTESKIDKE